MKLQISLFVFSVILLVPAARAQTPASVPWTVYTIKGEQLSIALPVPPTLQTFKDAPELSDKERKRNLLTCSVTGVVYSIQTIENIKPRLTLEEFVRQQARSYRDHFVFERNLTVDGIAGKAFLYTDNKGMVQFFVDDKRLYEIRAYGAPVDDPRIAPFFRDLSLKKQDGAIEVSEAVQTGRFDLAPGTVVPTTEVDTKVRLISKPEPTYTDKARNEWINGTVVLKVVLAADGTITHIQVVQGLPAGLTERAIAAARKIRFIPATKDGKNVSTWMQLEYNFNLTR